MGRDPTANRLLLLLLLAQGTACPREGQPRADRPPARADAERAHQDTAAPDSAAQRWRCDGDLAFGDIPKTPLNALIDGKPLQPTIQVARGSTIGREVAFDFAVASGWDRERPCFIPESPHFVGFKRVDASYAEELALPPGHYRLGPGWQAYYGHSAKAGRAVLVQPEFYGLLILETTTGLQRKPEQMFVPTGRARGRVAICFKDAQQSWIAGAFDVPVCGDTPTVRPEGTKAATR